MAVMTDFKGNIVLVNGHAAMSEERTEEDRLIH